MSTYKFDIPSKPYGEFYAAAQGAVDFSVQAFPIDGMLVLDGHSLGALYITKEQAMAFLI